MKIRNRLFFCMLILSAYSLNAATIFSDNFSNCSQSIYWTIGSDSLTKTCTNNALKVQNTSSTHSGIIYHQYGSTKPTTFTLSAKISKTSESATGGLFFCLVLSPTYKSYRVFITGQTITVMKTITGQPKDSTLFSTTNGYINKIGDNSITISKSGSKFTVMCNNRCMGSFTNNEISAGDMGLLTYPSSTVIFDDILVTDQYTECTKETCFFDNFNDGATLSGWSEMQSSRGTLKKQGGVLDITTSKGEETNIFVPLPSSEFACKVEVSHRSGNPDSYYGIFIMQEVVSGIIPMAGFLITGNRMYGNFINQEQFSLIPSQSVKGKAYQEGSVTTYYTDTLEIYKRSNSNEYLFIVNKDTLSKFNKVNFTPTSIGIVVGDSVRVQFDNFVAASGTTPSCQTSKSRMVVSPRKVFPLEGVYSGGYTLSGKKVDMLSKSSRSNKISKLVIYRNAIERK